MLVVAQTFNGDLYVSWNGQGYNCIRSGGAGVSPNDAVWGIYGDPYDDNESAHKYLNAWWYQGIINPALIFAEYEFVKNKWSLGTGQTALP